MTRLHVDLESRSACDLKACGVYIYANHPTTEITHCGWRVDDAPGSMWYPPRSTSPGQPIPPRLAALLADPTVTIVAHNASFERTMLCGPPGKRLGIVIGGDLARWDCTASRAAFMGLPRTLEGAAAALGLNVRKDKEGKKLMLRMCKPRNLRKKKSDPPLQSGTMAEVLWHDEPADILREGEYCLNDVDVEHALDRKLPALSPTERAAWECTERTNDRGVAVDDTLLLEIARVLEEAEQQINADISRRTNGQVPKVSDHGALTRWLESIGIDDALENGIGKAALAAYLENPDLPDFVRSVLMLRRDGGKSSAAKYKAILRRLSDDLRLRGALVYGGAASTLRWSSRGVQLHNLPRGGSVKDPLAAIQLIRDGATLEEIEFYCGPPFVVASELLRPVFVAAPGCWLGRGDYSQIEARVIAWLAGAEWKLEAFRKYDAGTGPDAYKIAAAGIYGTTADMIADDDPRRQVGKVSELALGFEGGAGALQAMAKGYKLKIPHFEIPYDADGEKDWKAPAPTGTDEWIKRSWRDANPEIKALWKSMGEAAFQCVDSPPGRDFMAANGRIRFRRNSEVMGLKMPGGRSLWYWSPRIATGKFGWNVRYRSEDSQTKQWNEFDGYGGLFTQNPVQAIARDAMAYALVKLEGMGIAPVLTVHDEAICEASKRLYPKASDLADAIGGVMRQVPPFLAGLPIAADASAHERYIKVK